MAMSDSRDIENINYILAYCKRIEEHLNRFGNRYNDFVSNYVYRDAISMCELQIGEHSIRLSDEFKEKYKEIPWAEIHGMRIILAYHYYKSKPQKIWLTATVDVPELRKFCEERLSEDPEL